jgi:flagellar biosynthesis protein
MQLRLNDLVPPQLYAAVAEVIAWAHQVDGKIEAPPRENQNRE